MAKDGFVVEQMIEQTDDTTMAAEGNVTDKERKVKMLPISFCIKARKLEEEERIWHQEFYI